MDCFVVFALDDLQQVYLWRLEAEEAARSAGRSALGSEELRRFVATYLPAYEAYRPQLYAAAEGCGVEGRPTWLCRVGRDRTVLG